MHSNDAPRTIERFAELGVARPSLAAGLTAIVAQRLVRRLCDACRRNEPVPLELGARFGLTTPTWYVPRGCGACANTGFSGRLGVYEMLVIDDGLRDTIGAGAPSSTLRKLAAATGYAPMFHDGREKVARGETSFAELLRVVAPSGAR